MNESPVLLVFMIVVSAYVAGLWWSDFRRNRRLGEIAPSSLPGAAPCSPRAVCLAAAGALLLVAGETVGESLLGISAEQSKITWLFGLYTLAAAFTEELVFRGYVVLPHRNKFLTWIAAFAASLLFALLHPFLWQWEEGRFSLTPTLKGWFSFGFVFAASLWFYACRLSSWNPARSLLPCIVAHAAKNLAVIAIKAAQGHVVGLW